MQKFWRMPHPPIGWRLLPQVSGTNPMRMKPKLNSLSSFQMGISNWWLVVGHDLYDKLLPLLGQAHELPHPRRAEPWPTESSSQPKTALLGFAEITQSLCGDNPPRIVSRIPLEEAGDLDPIQMIGSSMVSTCLFRDLAWGAMCINVIMYSLSVVGMGLDPTVADCHAPHSRRNDGFGLKTQPEFGQLFALVILNSFHLACFPWYVFCP